MNSKIIAVTFFILSAIIFSNVAFAADVDLFLSEQEINLFTGTSKTVELTVKNNQGVRDTFSISVFPSAISKVTNFPSPERVTADSGANATSKISFTAFLDALESQIFFNVTVKSLNYPNVIASRLIQVSVKRTVPVFISGAKVDKVDFKPEETATISVTVTNGGGLTSDKYILETLLKKAGKVVKIFTNEVSSMLPTSSKQINITYSFGKYEEPGEYTVVSVLKDLAGKQVSTSEDLKRISIKLGEVPSTTISDKSTQLGILNIKVIVKVKNEGNVPANNFYISEAIPFVARDIFDPELKPDVVRSEGTSLAYSWFVQSLAPGKEVVIVYQFNLWKVWFVLILIGAAVVVAFRYVFKIGVVKRVGHVGPLTKGKEIFVHLEVKNRSIGEVKDVVVRDSVPSIGDVVERFYTLKPVVKKTNTGTALIWRLDSLKAGEERVLSYSFKPRADIFGTLRLPITSVMYSTTKHQTKTSYSNRVIAGGKR